MTPIELNGEATERQLRLACSHVLNGWMPLDPERLSAMRAGVESGEYVSDRTRLLEEARGDPSLFLFCVRRLAEILARSSEAPQQGWHPTRIFLDAPDSAVKQLFEQPTGNPSRHRLQNTTKLQAERLVHGVLSSAVASAFAERHQVEPDLAYSAALLRNLGTTLIAYNYPRIYERVVGKVERPEDLDGALSNILGFSPSLLAVTLVNSWNLRPEIRAVVGDTHVEPLLDPDSQAVAQNLERVCKIGEALARASSPAHFPQAAAGWENAAAEIRRALGQNLFQELQRKLADSLQSYLKAAPEVFQLPELLTPAAETSRSGLAALEANKYVQYCPPAMRDKFVQLYSQLQVGTIEKSNIDFLVQELIIPAGFPRGCVYLVEPDTLTLMPRLAIGNTRLSGYRPVIYNTFNGESNPVVAAFRSPVPLLNESDSVSGSSIAASLGHAQRAGVLFLEISPQLLNDSNANPMVYFKALREAFNACLGLR